MLEHYATAKEGWRRVAGMGEAQSGQAPDVTATAVAVAASDAAVRVERIKEQWHQFVKQIARKVAFYLATDETIEIELDTRSLAELVPGAPPGAQAAFRGGGLTPREFAALSLEIDPLSIERTTETTVQQRIVQAFQLKLGAMQYVLQFPVPNVWERMFDQLGDAFNVPSMGADMRELAEAAALLMMQNPQPMQEPRKESYPSVSQGGSKSSAGPAKSPSANKTPGMPGGVKQPVPLKGAQGAGRAA
jgi:hypothetical protein